MREVKYLQEALRRLDEKATENGKAEVKTKKGELLLIAEVGADERTSFSHSTIRSVEVIHFGTTILRADFDRDTLADVIDHVDITSATDNRIIQNVLHYFLSLPNYNRIDMGFGPVKGPRFTIKEADGEIIDKYDY